MIAHAADEQQPVLREGALYFGDGGRILCSATTCAGTTAAYTGRDLSGQRVERIDIDAVQRWLAHGFAQMCCECGAVRLMPIVGSDRWPCVHSGGAEPAVDPETLIFDDGEEVR